MAGHQGPQRTPDLGRLSRAVAPHSRAAAKAADAHRALEGRQTTGATVLVP